MKQKIRDERKRLKELRDELAAKKDPATANEELDAAIEKSKEAIDTLVDKVSENFVWEAVVEVNCLSPRGAMLCCALCSARLSRSLL